MENKTEKPYSLQDAKESISKINGFHDWSYLRSKYSKDGIEITMAEAAELYASKATEELTERLKAAKAMMETYYSRSEELRKENEVMKGQLEFYRSETQKLRDYLEVNRIGKSNQKLFDALYEEIERLKESNKELVEALKGYKTEHELPNDNNFQYNIGYVKAINDALNLIRR